MSEAFDPRETGDQRAAPPASHRPDAWPSAYPALPLGAPPVFNSGLRPESGIYPPPPEYYLQRPRVEAFPPPPPEHMAEHMVSAQPGAAAVAAPQAKRGVGNPLWFLGSALISFALYAAAGGWQFGLGLVLLLFVHEMGHFVVIRAKGLPASLPIFIPFFGAFVAMRQMPRNARDEAEIALAGPLAGALAGGVCFAVYLTSSGADAQLWLWLAYFSFLINLVNLAPIAPLDGGRVAAAISRWFFVVGLVALVAAIVYTLTRPNSTGQLLLLLFLSWLWLMQTVARFRMPSGMGYYNIGVLSRLYVSVLYVALIGVLALAFYVTQNLFSGFPLFFQ